MGAGLATWLVGCVVQIYVRYINTQMSKVTYEELILILPRPGIPVSLIRVAVTASLRNTVGGT